MTASGDSQGSFISYAANNQVFGSITTTPNSTNITACVTKGGTMIARDIPDGLSNTIFWTERLAYCGGTVNRWAGAGGASTPLVGSKVVNALGVSPNIVPQFNIFNSANCNAYWPSSSHTAALMVGLGDGSVRSLNSSISKNSFNIAMVPNDSLTPGPDW